MENSLLYFQAYRSLSLKSWRRVELCLLKRKEVRIRIMTSTLSVRSCICMMAMMLLMRYTMVCFFGVSSQQPRPGKQSQKENNSKTAFKPTFPYRLACRLFAGQGLVKEFVLRIRRRIITSVQNMFMSLPKQKLLLPSQYCSFSLNTLG